MDIKNNQAPRILVITVSAWNSKVGSNTWSTVLQQYGSENIANLCIREENPDSSVCSRYFVISESKIIKSLINKKIKTGKEVSSRATNNLSADLLEHNNRYRKMKKKRRYSMLLARELIWRCGKWKTDELNSFLDSFNPDIILHSMEGYIHLNRIIEYAINRTGAKAVGYVWDDNFTYKQSTKLGYKIYRFFQRQSLIKLATVTNGFFAISEMTKKEADSFFNIDCKILTKPINIFQNVQYNNVVSPIHILYTGNLLIGRDRSLVRVCDAISQRYKGSFVIDVYTQTDLNENMIRRLESNGVCHIHSAIPQSEVLEKQKEADILLFLEDIDGPDAYTARLSFSTKITDYLSSGKCILAVGCADTAPMQYFIKNGAAAVATSEFEIMSRLEELSSNPELLSKYAEKARKIGIENHSKDKILSIFNETIISVLEEK